MPVSFGVPISIHSGILSHGKIKKQVNKTRIVEFAALKDLMDRHDTLFLREKYGIT